MHALSAAAFAAVHAVGAGQHGGADYERAEASAIKAGKPATLASFISKAPERYAEAVVKTRTVVAAMDDARRAGQGALTAAVDAIKVALVALDDEFQVQADLAWSRRGSGAGAVASERCDELLATMATLSALATWCSGVDRDFQSQGRGLLILDEVAHARHYCAKVYAKGIVPMDLPAKVANHLDEVPGFREWVHDAEQRHVVDAGRTVGARRR